MLISLLGIFHQSLLVKNERTDALKSSQDAAAAISHSVDTAAQPGFFSSRGDHSIYPPNVYAPQAQTFYYRG